MGQHTFLHNDLWDLGVVKPRRSYNEPVGELFTQKNKPSPGKSRRRCTDCGCILRRDNSGGVCSPCNQGEWF